MERAGIASKFEPQDCISNMPDNVLTNIIDRLPLLDAVRTGILSTNWRYKWTMLSQLIFDEDFFRYLSDRDGEDDYGRIISMFLLHLKGVITKFYLYIDDSWYSKHAAYITHWILFLSTNGIEDLTIEKGNGPPLELPTHFFSCLELKHLELLNCCFDPPPSFHGFPNLLSLELSWVQFESRKFWDYVTQCQVLDISNISLYASQVKPAEIGKLTNLKKLSLFLCSMVDDTMIISSSSIFELMGFLPKLEELDLVFSCCQLTRDVAQKRIPTTFPCLKTLELTCIDLGNGIGLSYAFQIIRSFPNLQTLRIISRHSDDDPTRAIGFPDVDYNTMRLMRLRTVEFVGLNGLENEVWLMKYLLACSPFLKKIFILLRSHLQSDEKSKFTSKLLKLHRASPVVDIKFV